jgi:glycosyltransferase involved in cell wall biosynthesis
VITTSARQEETFREETRAGVKIFSLRSRYPEKLRSWICLYNPLVAGRLGNLLAGLRPDVVHAHNLHRHLSFRALKLAKQTSARVFLTAHDAMLFHYGKLWEHISEPDRRFGEETAALHVSEWKKLRRAKLLYNPFRTAGIRKQLTHVDRVIAVSGSLRSALAANGIANVEVVYVGIDPARWTEPPEAGELERFRSRWNLAGRSPVFFAGRVNRLKGSLQAVKILKIVRARVPGATLVLAGKGPGVEETRRLAREAGIDDAVVTPGWLDPHAMRVAYFLSEVAIVPSIYLDPLPAITLEAMAACKPVVGTCFGGTKEVIVDGETGFVANPYDVNGFAGHVARLLADKSLAATLGNNGRRRFLSCFTMEVCIDRLLRLYQQ